jgi:hypothetical protein
MTASVERQSRRPHAAAATGHVQPARRPTDRLTRGVGKNGVSLSCSGLPDPAQLGGLPATRRARRQRGYFRQNTVAEQLIWNRRRARLMSSLRACLEIV